LDGDNVDRWRYCNAGAFGYIVIAVLLGIGSDVMEENMKLGYCGTCSNCNDDYIVQDDQFFIQNAIDWEDPDVIDDVFAQTDTKLDKFLNKSASVMFGDMMCYFGIVLSAFLATYIFWQIVGWAT